MICFRREEYKDKESQLPAQIVRQDKGKVALIKPDHCFGFGKTMIWLNEYLPLFVLPQKFEPKTEILDPRIPQGGIVAGKSMKFIFIVLRYPWDYLRMIVQINSKTNSLISGLYIFYKPCNLRLI